MAKKYTASERSRNAQKQLRDKGGRFLEQGGSFKYKGRDGKQKVGTIIGMLDGYVYALPQLENPHHRPMPFRIPMGSVESLKSKATIRDKETLAAEKKLLAENTKKFENNLSPSRKKSFDQQKDATAKAKKEKIDADQYEVKEDGTYHYSKRNPIAPDAKIQASLDAVLPTLKAGESFQFDLGDGYKMKITRENGKLVRETISPEGETTSRDDYSGKKGDQEASQAIAIRAKEHEDLEDPEEVMIDLDGDGINDIDDPMIRVDEKAKKTAPEEISKEDLDALPVNTRLYTDKAVYTKSSRRDDQGPQWSRHEKTDEKVDTYHLTGEELHSSDLMDGTKYRKEVKETPLEDLPEDHPRRVQAAKQAEIDAKAEHTQKRMDIINDLEKHSGGVKSIKQGLSRVGSELLEKLPESAERGTQADKTHDYLVIPKSDMSPEILESLPAGTRVSIKGRNGKSHIATKMNNDSWYTKKNFNDHLSKNEDQRTLSTEDVFNASTGDTINIASRNTVTSMKDFTDSEASRDAYRKILKAKAGGGTIDTEDDAKDVSELPDADNVTGLEAIQQLRRENTAQDSDPVGTIYKVEGDETYRKVANGQIINLGDSSSYYLNAKEFDDDFNSDGQGYLNYYVERPEPVNPPSPDAPVSPSHVSTDGNLPLPAEVTKAPKVKSGKRHTYATSNPIEAIKGLDGETYELNDTRLGRNGVVSELANSSNLDVENFNPKVLYAAEEGESVGESYHDGTPIRIGDEVLYNTGLKQNDVNSGEAVLARMVVTGKMGGKGDLLLFPLETVHGKTRYTVYEKDENGKDVRDSKGNRKAISSVVVDKSFGPESVIKNQYSVRSSNFEKMYRETPDGLELLGVREVANVSGRTGSFSLEDMYSQDGIHVSVGDEVKFITPKRSMNDKQSYDTVHSGKVVGFNTSNQSLVLDLGGGDDGEFFNASLKYTTAGDADPVGPLDLDSVQLPEGLIRDSQGRVLSEDSARNAEEIRDDKDGTAPSTVVPEPDRGVFDDGADSSQAQEDDGKVVEEIEGNFGEPATAEESKPKPKPKPAPAPRRRLIDSVGKDSAGNEVEIDVEYDSSIPRYFRDRKDKEYADNQEKATDWANSPIGSTIRLKGGMYAIKTSADAWEYRKSSRHLTQRGISNKQFAEAVASDENIMNNARTTAPTRKKFLTFNGGKVKNKAPETSKAPEGTQIDVDGDVATKSNDGWDSNGTLITDEQMDSLMAENPQKVKVARIPKDKVFPTKETKVMVQDSLFSLDDSGDMDVETPFGGEPNKKVKSDDIETYVASLVSSFDNIQRSDDDEGTRVVHYGVDGNFSNMRNVDPDTADGMVEALNDFYESAENIPKFSGVFYDDTELIGSLDAYVKPTVGKPGEYDLVVNPPANGDAEDTRDVYEAVRGGIDAHLKERSSEVFENHNATAEAWTNDYAVSISKSYDEIIKELGVKYDGALLDRAREDILANGSEASSYHRYIYQRMVSDIEIDNMFQREKGRAPKTKSERDRYKKKVTKK